MSRTRWVLLSMVLAAVVRVPAAAGLPQDADEPIYLRVAATYARALRAGDWSALAARTANPEHPQLVKLMHGVGIAALGEEPGVVQQLAVARGVSIVGGVGLAGLLAAVHPVAGLSVAAHTLHAKYTSQGYLEAWPMLWMFAGLLAWRRGLVDDRTRWVIGFGLLWGLASAGKMLHAVPGILMAVHWLARRPRRVAWLFVLPALVFLVANPVLWSDPAGGLGAVMDLHARYSDTLRDAGVHTAPWAPIAYLGGGGPAQWHPDVFPVTADGVILVAGLLGLAAGLRSSGPDRALARMAAAWFGLGLAVLMSWPTRWAQHALLLVPPVCLGVGWFAQVLGAWLSPASHHSAPTD